MDLPDTKPNLGKYVCKLDNTDVARTYLDDSPSTSNQIVMAERPEDLNLHRDLLHRLHSNNLSSSFAWLSLAWRLLRFWLSKFAEFRCLESINKLL